MTLFLKDFHCTAHAGGTHCRLDGDDNRFVDHNTQCGYWGYFGEQERGKPGTRACTLYDIFNACKETMKILASNQFQWQAYRARGRDQRYGNEYYRSCYNKW